MKKIIPGLILISLLALLVAPVTVKAYEMVESCTIKNSKTPDVVGCERLVVGGHALYADYAICCLMDKIYQVTDWIFVILIALVIIFVLGGGFLILMAGGSEEKVTKGKAYITWALVGFVIAILARAIPNIAYYFVK